MLGGMGAGKTTVGAMWAWRLAIWLCERGFCRRRPRAIGATGATQARISIIASALTDICRPGWFTHVKQRDGVPTNDLVLACGVTIELRATKQQSNATGTPIQGQNWSGHFGDEYQDQTSAHAHILARGRAAPRGIYKQLTTNTAKDSLAFREFRDSLPSEHWNRISLPAQSNAFVPANWWEDLKRQMSKREYDMLVLAKDVGPERAVYPSFDRTENLRPIPDIGARDVTELVLRSDGPNIGLLVGHDPGVLRNVSVYLRPFRLPGTSYHTWFIVGECTSWQTTTAEHAELLARDINEKFGIKVGAPDEPKVLVRTDPWTEREVGTHRSVYKQLRAAGFIVKAAGYRDGKPRHVPLQGSVELLNRLWCSASGLRRLFFQQLEDGSPAAPETYRDVQLSEWDSYGRKEVGDKGDKRHDPTDRTSCLRYGLWVREKKELKAPIVQRGVGNEPA